MSSQSKITNLTRTYALAHCMYKDLSPLDRFKIESAKVF